MGCLSKSLALVLTLVVAISSLSLLMIKTVSAQTINAPSVPEFSLRLVKHTFDLPPTSTIDPFTGQNTKIGGEQWEWLTVDVIIRNQNFRGSASLLSYSGLMYSVRFKGHYAQNWSDVSATSALGAELEAGPYLPQNSNASYTIFSIMINPNGPSEDRYLGSALPLYQLPPYDRPTSYIDAPLGGQVDFQVEALAGTISESPRSTGGWTFKGQESGWSNTESIILNEADATTVALTSYTPTVSELSWFVILPLLLSVFSVAVIVRHLKNRNKKT